MRSRNLLIDYESFKNGNEIPNRLSLLQEKDILKHYLNLLDKKLGKLSDNAIVVLLHQGSEHDEQHLENLFTLEVVVCTSALDDADHIWDTLVVCLQVQLLTYLCNLFTRVLFVKLYEFVDVRV